jgi:hypothetical protein
LNQSIMPIMRKFTTWKQHSKGIILIFLC